MELACQVLHGHLGPVYLLQVSENDDKKLVTILQAFVNLGHFCKKVGNQNSEQDLSSNIGLIDERVNYSDTEHPVLP